MIQQDIEARLFKDLPKSVKSLISYSKRRIFINIVPVITIYTDFRYQIKVENNTRQFKTIKDFSYHILCYVKSFCFIEKVYHHLEALARFYRFQLPDNHTPQFEIRFKGCPLLTDIDPVSFSINVTSYGVKSVYRLSDLHRFRQLIADCVARDRS